jgi:hypothetical protein
MTRHEIVLDLETSGRNPKIHVVTEVAWWNLDTDRRGHFFPPYPWERVRRKSDPVALSMTRYLERIVPAVKDDDLSALGDLYGELAGTPFGDGPEPATIVGANPGFDARFLRKLFKRQLGNMCWSEKTWDRFAPWHYRMVDIESYAKAVLALDYMPSLLNVCELLGLRSPADVALAPDHAAATDVLVTGLAYQKLSEMAKVQRNSWEWSEVPQ